MKTLKFTYAFLFIFCQNINAQKETSYIKKDRFTKIVSVTELGNHGDDFLRVNVFNGEFEKVEWGSSINIISYRYLGVDSQNNLHIQRKEHNYSLKSEDVCELIFKLDLNKSTEITLIAQRSQKVPLQIKIQIEAGNNFIKSKYIGDLPVYTE